MHQLLYSCYLELKFNMELNGKGSHTTIYIYMISQIENPHQKNIFQLLSFSLQTIFSQIRLFLHILIYFILDKGKYYFKSFSPYKQCRLAREYSQVARLVVFWGQRAKLLSITSKNSVDDAYHLKRATQSVPQLRHLLLVILLVLIITSFR